MDPSPQRVARRFLAATEPIRRPEWLERIADGSEETLQLDKVDRGRWLVETCRHALAMEDKAEKRLEWARSSDANYEKLKTAATRANTAMLVAERIIKGTANEGEHQNALGYLDRAIRGLDAWGAHE